MKLKMNGPATMVALIREAPIEIQHQWQKKLTDEDLPLALMAQHYSFIYNDIPKLTGKSVLVLLNSISNKKWLFAWKLSTPETKRTLLDQMSSSRQKQFLEDFKDLRKVPRSYVVKIQISISKEINQGLKKGTLFLS